MSNLIQVLKGGPGSGDWGHTGRAGKRGGSGGGGGKGKPRRGRRSREALNKEIEAGKKPKVSSVRGRVTNDVVNLEEDKNIKKLHENFDAHEAGLATPNEGTVLKIAESSGVDRWTVDGYMGNWNSGTFDQMHLTSQSAQKTLGAKFSSYEEANRNKWEAKLEELNIPDEVKSEYDDITKAVYVETQRQFKELGITEVVLYRGMSDLKFDIPVGGTGHYESNSLDSWTTDSNVADSFATNKVGGFVMKTSMPVERIFSMSSSGPGTSDQREMIVLGTGSNDEVYISGRASK